MPRCQCEAMSSTNDVQMSVCVKDRPCPRAYGLRVGTLLCGQQLAISMTRVSSVNVGTSLKVRREDRLSSTPLRTTVVCLDHRSSLSTCTLPVNHDTVVSTTRYNLGNASFCCRCPSSLQRFTCFSRFLCLPLVCAVSVLHVLCLVAQVVQLVKENTHWVQGIVTSCLCLVFDSPTHQQIVVMTPFSTVVWHKAHLTRRLCFLTCINTSHHVPVHLNVWTL